VPPIDPCLGALELPAPRHNVCRVEWERKVLVPKPGIPYENGGPISLWVNGAVITTIDRIIPLLEVEAVDTIVVHTDDGLLGGGTPPVVTVVEGI
jgi:hypothetical protein